MRGSTRSGAGVALTTANRRQRPLDGTVVLVTRPEQQADHLCALIEAAGGTALRLAVLAIAEPEQDELLRARLAGLKAYHLALFVSANAVHRGLPRVEAGGGFPDTIRVAAVGQATARALAQHGRRVDLCPARDFSSEALLALAELQDLHGHRVLIFRGQGGRELLAETLRARGAQVDYAEVYRRVPARPDCSALMRAWARGQMHVVVATSGEILRALYDLLEPHGQRALCQTALVVVSDRMLKLARELGFSADVVVAERAADESIVDAVVRWRAHAI